jgi:hypothetical protein
MGCGGRPLLPQGQGVLGEQNAGANFAEAFVAGQTGKWLIEQDTIGSAAIVNEQLLITVAAPNTVQYSTLQEKVYGDFALEVDVTQVAGPPESSYGVLFRVKDGQQFYRFDITGNGLYIIERHNGDGTWTRLVQEWTPASALNQGLNVTNRLRVLASGQSLTFYANDVLLTQVNDATYADGLIGLDAGTFGGSNLQVAFDNLTITGSAP